jgi:hypothetical protein
MCCVADEPPTASNEPAAYREPEVEIDTRELAPGEAKYEEVEELMLVEVKSPTADRAEISEGVKAVPLIEAEFGLAFIKAMYFSVPLSVSVLLGTRRRVINYL